ncbi:MAG: TRAP transporter TatT component family protein [Vicinamibacterales bacterium]
MASSARHPVCRLLAAALAASALAGCGMIKKAAINNVAGTLSSSGDVFTRDNDPELVREALPFALKLYESLLESVPKNKDLLIATCSAFTQYGYAFVETDADVLGEAHHDEARALRERALKLYIRAKDYCLRAFEVRFPGVTPKLLANPELALKKAEKKDVPLLYWTAASWGAAISLGLDMPDLVVDHPTVRALAERALALDPIWSHGAIHEALITLDSLPEALGGSPSRARDHFAKAVEIQKGLSPGPYVELAVGVAVPAQDRAEFTKLLNDAVAIDPEKDPSNRLVTLIMQRRARALLDQIDTLFAK